LLLHLPPFPTRRSSDLVTLRPLAHPVLYLPDRPCDASPKAISGRTSYLQVRLAYHPYPQLIPQLCNVERFGPPRRISSASAWPRSEEHTSELQSRENLV